MEKEKNSQIIHFYFKPIILLLFFFLLLFLGVPIYSILYVAQDFKMFFVAMLMLLITSYLTIKVFKYAVILVQNKPAFILDKNILHDLQTNTIIKWEDIENIKMDTVKSLTYISIKLKKDVQEKYIQNISNPILKYFYRLNSKVFFGTFTINLSLLKDKNEFIFKTVENYLAVNKK